MLHDKLGDKPDANSFTNISLDALAVNPSMRIEDDGAVHGLVMDVNIPDWADDPAL
jgi:hypothetical protein